MVLRLVSLLRVWNENSDTTLNDVPFARSGDEVNGLIPYRRGLLGEYVPAFIICAMLSV